MCNADSITTANAVSAAAYYCKNVFTNSFVYTKTHQKIVFYAFSYCTINNFISLLLRKSDDRSGQVLFLVCCIDSLQWVVFSHI